MEKKIVNTNNAPKAIGPYNQAVVANGFIYLSGQIPLEPKTGEIVSEDITGQTHQVFKNISAILTEIGIGFENIVKTTCFLSDLGNFQEFNTVYTQYFSPGKEPSRSTIEVSALPKGAKVEVEVIAVID